MKTNLEELLAGELDRAYRLALVLAGGEEDAAEAVQEACASVLGAGAPAEGLRSPRAWFLKAVVHSARKQQRSEARRRAREEAWAMDRGRSGDLPDELAARNELAAELRGALLELDEKRPVPAPAPAPAAAANGEREAGRHAGKEAPALPKVKLTPRGASAWPVLEELRRKGLRVVHLGRSRKLTGRFRSSVGLYAKTRLLIPRKLRGTEMDGLEFVRAVAECRGLRVHLARNCVVLHAGAPDAKVARIRDGLKSPDAAKRREAAWLGGWIEDVRVLPFLAGALQDPDADVVYFARRSLRTLGLDAALAVLPEDKRLWTLMREDCGSSDREIQRRVVRELGNLGGRAAQVLLRELLAEDERNRKRKRGDPKRRMRVSRSRILGAIARADANEMQKLLAASCGQEKYEALRRAWPEDQLVRLLDLGIVKEDGSVGGNPSRALKPPTGVANLPSIRKRLRDKGRFVASGAAYELGELPSSAEVVSLLAKGLRSSDKTVRYSAVLSLGDLDDSGVTKLIVAMLSDRDLTVRSGAVAALAVGPKGALESAADEALRSKHADVRQRICAALGCRDSRESRQLLRRAAKDSDSKVRLAALNALAGVDPESALKELSLALPDLQGKDPLGVAGVLGRLDGAGAVALINRMLEDRRPMVCLRAILALTRMRGMAAEAALNAARKHWYWAVRCHALRRLGVQKADPQEFRKVVLGALLVNVSDPSPRARQSAAYALAREHGKTGRDALLRQLRKEADGETRSTIIKALRKYQGKDPEVRRALAGAPTKLKPPAPPEPPEVF